MHAHANHADHLSSSTSSSSFSFAFSSSSSSSSSCAWLSSRLCSVVECLAKDSGGMTRRDFPIFDCYTTCTDVLHRTGVITVTGTPR